MLMIMITIWDGNAGWHSGSRLIALSTPRLAVNTAFSQPHSLALWRSARYSKALHFENDTQLCLWCAARSIIRHGIELLCTEFRFLEMLWHWNVLHLQLSCCLSIELQWSWLPPTRLIPPITHRPRHAPFIMQMAVAQQAHHNAYMVYNRKAKMATRCYHTVSQKKEQEKHKCPTCNFGDLPPIHIIISLSIVSLL